MLDTITRYLAGVAGGADRKALNTILTAIGTRLSSKSLSAGGLQIKAGGSAVAKTVNTVYFVVGGKHYSLAAGDITLTTANNISLGKYNVVCIFVNAAGTITPTNGIEAATAAAVTFPETPAGSVMIGYILITYASAFVGGTTVLDTATSVYVDVSGAFDPTILP